MHAHYCCSIYVFAVLFFLLEISIKLEAKLNTGKKDGFRPGPAWILNLTPAPPEVPAPTFAWSLHFCKATTDHLNKHWQHFLLHCSK